MEMVIIKVKMDNIEVLSKIMFGMVMVNKKELNFILKEFSNTDRKNKVS
jgi:hypothetical protein